MVYVSFVIMLCAVIVGLDGIECCDTETTFEVVDDTCDNTYLKNKEQKKIEQ